MRYDDRIKYLRMALVVVAAVLSVLTPRQDTAVSRP